MCTCAQSFPNVVLFSWNFIPVNAGDAAAAKTRGQMIERKIEALEDMATKVRSLTVDNVTTLFDSYHSCHGR